MDWEAIVSLIGGVLAGAGFLAVGLRKTLIYVKRVRKTVSEGIDLLNSIMILVDEVDNSLKDNELTAQEVRSIKAKVLAAKRECLELGKAFSQIFQK